MLIEYAQLMSTAHRMLDGVMYQGKTKAGRNIKRYKLQNTNEEENYLQGVSLQSSECSMG